MVDGCRPSRSAISPIGRRASMRRKRVRRGRAGGRSGPKSASEVQTPAKVGDSHFAIEPTTDFFVDKGESGGVTCEYMRAFEAFLRERQGGRGAKVTVSFVPVSRDRLIPALLAGEGDLAAANLTVTPERRARVDFSEPYLEEVREVVVTGPASPELATVD